MAAGMRPRSALTTVATLGTLVVAAACGGSQPATSASAESSASAAVASGSPPGSASPDGSGAHAHAGAPVGGSHSRPLRAGERFQRLRIPTSYTPSAPYGAGTDDYHCFLLDPHLVQDAFITGINVLPDNPKVVHHVILFRVPPGQVAAAEAKDASTKGEGWTCFGSSGLDNGAQLDNAPWLGAWAPGGGESVMAPDVGVPLPAGSRIVMQVHYNLLAGTGPDRTAAKLRLVSGSANRTALQTMLLPAPVELPCRPGHDGPLCNRAAALADVQRRFGEDVGQTANALHLLCGTDPPGPVQQCTQTVREPATIRAAAGHMHLLGRSIRIDVNPGTPRARKVLDIPVWDFDNQGAKPVRPVRLKPGDTVRVTCRHDQRLRDLLPSFRGQPERYVVWGEGTTDEMCLGMLLVTHP
jgi:hypothetical protein